MTICTMSATLLRSPGTDRYEAPIHVEAGASGDFYVADEVRDRITRFHPDGQRVATYVIPRSTDGPDGVIRDIRVCESTSSVYAITSTGLLALFFHVSAWATGNRTPWSSDLAARFSYPHRCETATRRLGGWDVDDAGVLYVTDGWSRRAIKTL